MVKCCCHVELCDRPGALRSKRSPLKVSYSLTPSLQVSPTHGLLAGRVPRNHSSISSSLSIIPCPLMPSRMRIHNHEDDRRTACSICIYKGFGQTRPLTDTSLPDLRARRWQFSWLNLHSGRSPLHPTPQGIAQHFLHVHFRPLANRSCSVSLLHAETVRVPG